MNSSLGPPWLDPANEARTQRITAYLLHTLRDLDKNIDWRPFHAHLQLHLAPWLTLSLSDDEEHHRDLDALAVTIADEVRRYGLHAAPDILLEHGLAARLDFADRWLRRAVRATASQQLTRQELLLDAEALDLALTNLDDSLQQEHPLVRDAFADQLSEMFLDIEYLLTGTPGSLRHAHLLSNAEATQ